MTDEAISRETLDVDGRRMSYLHGGEGSPVLLLHGTFWSRVWLPVLPRLAEHNAVYALDFPGFGRSEGRLEAEEASVPALADLVLRAADTMGIEGPFALAGHDIGGGVVQHVAARGGGASRGSRWSTACSMTPGRCRRSSVSATIRSTPGTSPPRR